MSYVDNNFVDPPVNYFLACVVCVTDLTMSYPVSDFDTQVGLSYLRGIHLNDSKALLGSQRDRHENIGL